MNIKPLDVNARACVRQEFGNETVQFVISLLCLFVMVFGTFQLGFLVFSVSEVTSEITQACRSLDVAGLELAHDKDAFVKQSILGERSRLLAANLDVSGTTYRTEKTQSNFEGLGAESLQGRNEQTTLRCKVSYRVPVLFQIPGVSTWELRRNVACVYVDQKVAEVDWGSDEPL